VAVTRLFEREGRVAALGAVDRTSGERLELKAERIVLAAGALATPHLLLASGLGERNPAGQAVGRYLTRHCNGIVIGVFPKVPDRGLRFHKQVAFHDFYFGSPGSPGHGTLGSIQQLQTPPIALVKANAPRLMGPFLSVALPHTTGLLVMAEDQPRLENGITLDATRRDALGLPRASLRHRYTARDLRGRHALFAQARRILRKAGALFFYRHEIKTFSHAAGTVRFGEDPRSAPLDPLCRFRGLDNLYVTDASFMPTGGGVNPSLTIAANALRVGEALVKGTA
jgi:choline dehydrogenase-like flavoprotein